MNLFRNKQWLRFRGKLFASLWIASLGLYIFSNSLAHLGKDIPNLKNEYIAYSYKDGNVIYKIQKNKPSSWSDLSEIASILQWAIVLSEDWAFFQHEGLDYQQIQKVLENALTKGEIKRGASTISQQVVKNIFLTSERTITRKLKEFYLVKILERHLSKKQILTIYLNIIELGKEVHGVKKASQFYFEKSPLEVEAHEAAFLAMLLPSPIRYAESFRKRQLTDYARKTVDDILQKCEMAKVLSEADLSYYSGKPLRFEDDQSHPELETPSSTGFWDEEI